MNKNIWILNHYATNTYQDRAGRHFWYAKNLIENDYNTTIFCASTVHNSNVKIETDKNKYISDSVDGIPYVFVKTPSYSGNGRKRIINMISFYLNLFPVTKQYAKAHGKPDVIIASSVHPLTLVAGIKIAKKFRIPCICEIRDLWPESMVAYGALKRNSILSKILYQGEKWIYKKADKLIFTMEGGKDYIINKGWNKENRGPIDTKKVYHINNGVDLEVFDYNRKTYIVDDVDLNNDDIFKIVYAGSIRKVNNVRKIVDVASYIKEKGYHKIKFLIYGDGTEKRVLEQYCLENKIHNIIFKGKIEKNKIPFILSKCDLNIIHFNHNNIKQYGASLNKMFEYFASGKPTVSDCEFGYDLIKKYKSGIVVDNAQEKELADIIIQFSNMGYDEYNEYCLNAYRAAQDYDFRVLTHKLEKLI